MIIKQAAQQLPPVNIKMLLKLGVREPGSVRPIKEADQRLKLPPACGNASSPADSPAGRRQAPGPAAASSLSACPQGRTSSPER
jgi:hypothetical protein